MRANKQRSPILDIDLTARLREDIGFDSLDLAEPTVRIEDKFGIDVFADGVVHTVGGSKPRYSRDEIS